MARSCSPDRFSHFLLISLICAWAPLAFAQRPSPGSGTGSSSTGSPGRSLSSTTNNPNGFPGSGNTNPSGYPNAPSIFLSGRVSFDDGSPTNANIRIERVCNGTPHLETHTDSKGNFYFQLGQNQSVDVEAVDGSDPSDPFNKYPGQVPASGQSFPANSTYNNQTSTVTNVMFSCDVRASYPGYRSDLISLAGRHTMDNPEIGTIVLHRLTEVKGTTISMTTALAPKRAQKQYQKGVDMARKGDFDAALIHFTKATTSYPKYAIAWFDMGDIQQRTGKTEDARKSFIAAIAADKRFVSPYDRLALMSAQQSKWQDAADYSKKVIDLNPVEFPSSFYLNALANYNLKKRDEAEKSVRMLLKLDTAHAYPVGENLLAQILLEKGDYAQAATHLRAYLALVPKADNAEALKQALAKLDQASAPAPANK